MSALVLGGAALPAQAAPGEIVADRPGDAGPGTLADAIARANAQPGVDTVLVRGAITLAAPIRVTESLVIRGEGIDASSISFADPAGGSMLVADAGPTTVSLAGLSVSGAGAAGVAPLIEVAEADPARPVELSELRITGAGAGFIRIGSAPAPLTLRGVDASASATAITGEAGRAAATIVVSALSASVTVSDSDFHDDTLAALALAGVDLADDELVTISDSRFRNVVSRDQPYGVLSLTGRPGATAAASSPVLRIADSTFDRVGGVDGMFLANETVGRLAVERSEFLNSGHEFAEDRLNPAIFVSSNSTGGVRVTDSRFLNNEFAVLSALTGSIAGGPALALENTTIEGSSPSGRAQTGVARLELSPSEDADEPVLLIRNSTISGGRGTQHGAVHLNYVSRQRYVAPEHVVVVEGSTFVDNVGEGLSHDLTLRLNGARVTPAPGVLIRDSTFVGSATGAPSPDVPSIRFWDPSSPFLLDHVTMSEAAVKFVVTPGRVAPMRIRNSVIVSPEGVPAVGSNSNTVPPVEVESSALTDPGQLPGVGAVPAAEIMLGELGEHGGPTRTMLPGPDSSLIDAGIAGELTGDQRGSARAVGPAPDLGAVELDGGTLTMGADARVGAGEPLRFSVTRSGAAELPATTTVRLTPGTAVPGVDYVDPGEPVTLSWAAGETGEKVVALPTLATVPGERSLTATIEGQPRGTALADRIEATGTITQAQPGTPPGEEGEGPATPPAPPAEPQLPGTGGPGASGLGWLALLLLGAGALLRRGRGARGARG